MTSFISLLCTFFILANATWSYAANGRCGPEHSNALCDTDQGCCSASGYCGITAEYCQISNGCQANCTDGTPTLRPVSIPTSSPPSTSSTSAASEAKLTQTNIIIIAVIGAVVLLGIVGGVLFFLHKRRKAVQDKVHQLQLADKERSHQLEIIARDHQHAEGMAQHQTTQSQLDLVRLYGRDILAIMPASAGEPASGLRPGTMGISGSGRVLGPV